jgi:hypothetical protein
MRTKGSPFLSSDDARSAVSSAGVAARPASTSPLTGSPSARPGYADALDHAEQALALFQATADRAGQAAAVKAVGWCHILLGDPHRARAFCQRALALNRTAATAAARRSPGTASATPSTSSDTTDVQHPWRGGQPVAADPGHGQVHGDGTLALTGKELVNGNTVTVSPGSRMRICPVVAT